MSSATDLQASLKEAFTLFDRDCDGLISSSELASILRSIGYTPSQADLTSYASKLDPSSANRITLSQVSSLVATIPPPPSSAELEKSLMDAFRVFDKDGSGRIDAHELRHIMTSVGEKLTEAEADEMMRQADPGNTGAVDYAAFVKRLVSV